jgi:hypothetical protein
MRRLADHRLVAETKIDARPPSWWPVFCCGYLGFELVVGIGTARIAQTLK